MELERYSFVLLKRGPRAAEFSDEDKSAWTGNRGVGLASAKAAAEAAFVLRSCGLVYFIVVLLVVQISA